MHKIYEPALQLADKFIADRLVSRIWDRDIAAWGAAPGSADAASIQTRLGWLDVASTMAPELERVEALGLAAREEGIQAVYLLGMGGSSLCAEVLRQVYGIADGYPELVVLDTTDGSTIAAAADAMDPVRTLILVASKSGGTVEVASMERYFWGRMTEALGARAGRQFVAVTDPGTALHRLAGDRGYQEVFLNPPDIGGRFSALSLFGLVPAALIGAPVRDIHAAGEAMAEGCRQENRENAGLMLGAFIGATLEEGRDKLTVSLAPSLASLGLWIEQLVAESTGKHGKGALPLVDEPLGSPSEYASDRAFIAVSTERDGPDAEKLARLEKAGHPVLRLSTRLGGLGSEFFRWEFATAVAGAALGINPFDEPNVSEAKEKTRALLDAFAAKESLAEPDPTAQNDQVAVFSRTFRGETPAAVVRAALDSVRPPDYVAFLSYLPAGSDTEVAIGEARAGIRVKKLVGSTFGVGPRYLHSTGQYHKGGPNTAVAFVITADDTTTTGIPDAGYSFNVLKRAQALGDVETLEAHDRRAVRIHLEDAAAGGRALGQLFAEALKER
ncbi:MAG: glucose-6-phosphate isomerase [Acidobacteria bacterium]|nr:glucose-6-phosphate isomerase [Acidobacteriota bacterium]